MRDSARPLFRSLHLLCNGANLRCQRYTNVEFADWRRNAMKQPTAKPLKEAQ